MCDRVARRSVIVISAADTKGVLTVILTLPGSTSTTVHRPFIDKTLKIDNRLFINISLEAVAGVGARERPSVTGNPERLNP